MGSRREDLRRPRILCGEWGWVVAVCGVAGLVSGDVERESGCGL